MNDRFWQRKDVIPPAEAGRLLRAKRIVDQQYRALYGEEILGVHGKMFVSYRRDDAPGDARSICMAGALRRILLKLPIACGQCLCDRGAVHR